MPPILRAALGLISLCVLLSATACSSGKLITRTVLVDKPVRQYVAVPEALTEATPEPPKPAPACADAGQRAVLCNRQLLDWIDAWREALGLANADKARIAEVTARTVSAAQ